MQDRSFEDQLTIHLESAEVSAAPGSSVVIPVAIHNHGPEDGFFELAVTGIPSTWLSVPAPVVRLAAGEQRQVSLTIQPPLPPVGRAGRHQMVIRASSQERPAVAAEATCMLTVAALEAPGRIGMLLAATEYPVAPGESVSIPLVLFNQGLERDVVSLSVEGIPSSWVSASAASTALMPGQQQEVTLKIEPPRSGAGGAGRHPFRILAASQAAPGQVTTAKCILTIATFSQFGSELRPQRIEAGVPARLMVENQGNVQQVFSLTWQSPDDGLAFEPAPAQELRVAPGEVAIAEFSAKPRKRPLLGRERTWPFTARVQAAQAEARNLNGEVVGKPLIPSWVLPTVLVAILIFASIVILSTVLGGSDEGTPTPVAEVTATPGEEQPMPTEPPPEELPTEPPPEELPTEPPPEEPPTEPPPEEPPTEPPPEEPPTEPPPEEQPTEPPDGVQLPADPEDGDRPCTLLAAVLIFAPMLVMSKKGRDKRQDK
jgi:hypothetical protein